MNDKEKKIPIRKCVVSGERYPKVDMLRIVSLRGGPIRIDLTGKAPGRGCYVYPDPENYHKLIKSKASQVAKALKKPISEQELEYLKNNLLQAFDEKKFRKKYTKPVAIRIRKEDLEKLNQAS
ncbi:MAG: hypothetical protein KatS3mg084_0118 [Candidatus Dojkabacteria bacterium]|nr:MAG: hypothetical protein KatS3mg084_0118 [Candidatus Dojkabacteria bacterium]